MTTPPAHVDRSHTLDYLTNLQYVSAEGIVADANGIAKKVVTPAIEPATPYIQGEQITFWLDELSNKLKYKARYTSGSVASGEIDLVPVPVAPTLTSAVAGNGSVRLTWTDVGATGYKIKYGTTSASYTSVIDVGAVFTKNITSLTNNTTYYFIIVAYDTAESDYSNERSAKPIPPPIPTTPVLAPATAGPNSMYLNWTSIPSAAGYKVKYGTEPGQYGTILNIGAITSYVITGLDNNDTYYVAVSAYNISGESANSNEVNATPSTTAFPLLFDKNFDGDTLGSLPTPIIGETYNPWDGDEIIIVTDEYAPPGHTKSMKVIQSDPGPSYGFAAYVNTPLTLRNYILEYTVMFKKSGVDNQSGLVNGYGPGGDSPYSTPYLIDVVDAVAAGGLGYSDPGVYSPTLDYSYNHNSEHWVPIAPFADYFDTWHTVRVQGTYDANLIVIQWDANPPIITYCPAQAWYTGQSFSGISIVQNENVTTYIGSIKIWDSTPQWTPVSSINFEEQALQTKDLYLPSDGWWEAAYIFGEPNLSAAGIIFGSPFPFPGPSESVNKITIGTLFASQTHIGVQPGGNDNIMGFNGGAGGEPPYDLRDKCQTFTTGANAILLDTVEVQIAGTSGTTGTVTMTIRPTDISGHPTATVLGTSTLDWSTVPIGIQSKQTFNFGTPVSLTANTKYAMHIHVGGGDASVGFGGTNEGDWYVNGEILYQKSDTNWDTTDPDNEAHGYAPNPIAPDAQRDLWFKIYAHQATDNKIWEQHLIPGSGGPFGGTPYIFGGTWDIYNPMPDDINKVTTSFKIKWDQNPSGFPSWWFGWNTGINPDAELIEWRWDADVINYPGGTVPNNGIFVAGEWNTIVMVKDMTTNTATVTINGNPLTWTTSVPIKGVKLTWGETLPYAETSLYVDDFSVSAESILTVVLDKNFETDTVGNPPTPAMGEAYTLWNGDETIVVTNATAYPGYTKSLRIVDPSEFPYSYSLAVEIPTTLLKFKVEFTFKFVKIASEPFMGLCAMHNGLFAHQNMPWATPILLGNAPVYYYPSGDIPYGVYGNDNTGGEHMEPLAPLADYFDVWHKAVVICDYNLNNFNMKIDNNPNVLCHNQALAYYPGIPMTGLAFGVKNTECYIGYMKIWSI